MSGSSTSRRSSRNDILVILNETIPVILNEAGRRSEGSENRIEYIRFFAVAQNDILVILNETDIVILNGAVRRSEGSGKGKEKIYTKYA